MSSVIVDLSQYRKAYTRIGNPPEFGSFSFKVGGETRVFAGVSFKNAKDLARAAARESGVWTVTLLP